MRYSFMVGWCLVVGSLGVAASKTHIDGLLIVIFSAGATMVGMALESKLWERHALAIEPQSGKVGDET